MITCSTCGLLEEALVHKTKNGHAFLTQKPKTCSHSNTYYDRDRDLVCGCCGTTVRYHDEY